MHIARIFAVGLFYRLVQVRGNQYFKFAEISDERGIDFCSVGVCDSCTGNDVVIVCCPAK